MEPEDLQPKDLSAELEAAEAATVAIADEVGDGKSPQREIPPSQPRPLSPGQAEIPEIEDNEDLDDPPEVAQPPPPAVVPERKINERLRRIFKPRANGSYLVPMDMLQEYNSLHTRKRVMAMFEKVGYDPDRDFKQGDCF